MVSAWPETKTCLLVTKRTAMSLRNNCKDYEIGAHLNRRLFIFALLIVIILFIIPKKDRKKKTFQSIDKQSQKVIIIHILSDIFITHF